MNFKAIFTLALLLWGASATHATHFKGMELQYVCTGPCNVRISAQAYLVCMSTPLIAPTLTTTPQGLLCPNLTPGSTSGPVTTEVTPLCPGAISTCTSASATINGIQSVNWYFDFDYCNAPNNCIWTIDWISCCRTNNTIVTTANVNYGIVSMTLNSSVTPCNNSPQFPVPAALYFCGGQTANFSMGATDPDGDSLSYSLGPCYGITYGVNTPTTPLGSNWQVSIDAATGNMTFVPSPGNLAVSTICVFIEEWRNGVLINTSVRDWEVIFIPCPNNQQPQFTAYSNISPNVSQNGDVFTMQTGTPICLDLGATDANSSTQNLKLFWDSSIPGATFTDASNASITDTVSGQNPIGRFCFTTSVAGIYRFFVRVEDDACPIPGRSTRQIIIAVRRPPSTANAVPGNTCLQANFTAQGGGNGPFTYSWTGSGGLNSNMPTFSYTYPAPGTYTWQVIITNGTTINDTLTGSITTAPIDISGTITTSTSAAMTNQKVYLITHDFNNNSLTARDSTTTDNLGYYAFCAVPYDSVYIKAAPDSAIYPTEIPTYADTAIFWNNARPILSVNFPTTVNFSTKFGANPGGPGFIGGLISQGANKRQAPGDPMPNIRVILYSNTLNQFVDETYSDINGYFSFSNIPLGDYEVSVDVAGVDHLIVPSLNLDSSTPIKDSLDFRLHSTYFELRIPTGRTPSIQTNFNFETFPNPSHAATNIFLELKADTEVLLRVFNLQGREIKTLSKGTLKLGEHHFIFNPIQDGLTPGIYFIRLDAPFFSKTIRFLAIK